MKKKNIFYVLLIYFIVISPALFFIYSLAYGESEYVKCDRVLQDCNGNYVYRYNVLAPKDTDLRKPFIACIDIICYEGVDYGIFCWVNNPPKAGDSIDAMWNKVFLLSDTQMRNSNWVVLRGTPGSPKAPTMSIE